MALARRCSRLHGKVTYDAMLLAVASKQKIFVGKPATM